MLEHIYNSLVRTGWTLIPLALTSVVGWFLVFHRWMVLTQMEWRHSSWRQKLVQPEFGMWIQTLTKRDRATVTGGVLHTLYQTRSGGREAMENTLDEFMKFQLPELDRSLSTLAIVASAAPLMGLLGTVSGMVETFEVIRAFGTGNQALMSDSISESLLATQNGLLVAFPLMLVHVFLATKSEAIENEAWVAAQTLINQASGNGVKMGVTP